MVSKIQGTGAAQSTQSTKGKKVKKSADYEKKQEALAARIQDPPQGVNGLRSNAKIKEQQIQLAKQNGDYALAQQLQVELDRINADIKRNESSVFDEAKADKD